MKVVTGTESIGCDQCAAVCPEDAIRVGSVGRDRLLHGATAVVAVASAPDASCPSDDCHLATQNILLAAHAMGLGTCLIGFAVEAMRYDKRVQDSLGIPRRDRVASVIALGYPAIRYQRPTGRRNVKPRTVTAGQIPPAR